jgi:hypothetical protein
MASNGFSDEFLRLESANYKRPALRTCSEPDCCSGEHAGQGDTSLKHRLHLGKSLYLQGYDG